MTSFSSMTPAQLSTALGVSVVTAPSAATMTNLATTDAKGYDDASGAINPSLIIAIAAGAAVIVALLVIGYLYRKSHPRAAQSTKQQQPGKAATASQAQKQEPQVPVQISL
jgi:ABC-type Fe3+ transport system permease subunit